MKLQAIIFDLDGTLWNSLEAIYRSVNKLLKRHNINPLDRDEASSYIGMPMDEIFSALFKGKKIENPKAIMKEFIEIEEEMLEVKEYTFLFKDMVETLEKLKKDYKLFIVSNCQKGYIEKFIEIYNLEYLFDDYLSWGDTLEPKGNNIITVMERNNIEKAVYVGDTRGDELAAISANMPFIYVSFGYGNANDIKYKIDNYKELNKVIESLDI